jgi:hypothetical protein
MKTTRARRRRSASFAWTTSGIFFFLYYCQPENINLVARLAFGLGVGVDGEGACVWCSGGRASVDTS